MNGGTIDIITPEEYIVVEDIKMYCARETKFSRLFKNLFSNIHAAK
jgi:hypothetical protein